MSPFLKNACEIPPTGASAAFALQLQGQLPTLSTERLILRAPKVEDFEHYATIMCSDRAQYMGGPFNREDAWADFCNATATWILHGHGMWTIGFSGGVAGFVLIGLEPGDLEPELGFLLLEEHEGHDVAYEAAVAARDYAFETLGRTTLVSYIDPRNIASRRLAGRLGGRVDGDTDGSLIYRYSNEALQ